MKQTFLIISFFIFNLFEVMACSCSYAWNDSFSLSAKQSELVALVKIIAFDEYLEYEIIGYEGKMPYSMTTEIVKKYKGEEKNKRIKIFGDNGMLCRPYLSEFKINGYYLIAPVHDKLDDEYFFYSCQTDYLKVDISKNKAYGKYSFIRNEIDLNTFENKLENGDWDLTIILTLLGLGFIFFIFKKRKNKTNANKG